MTARRDDLRRIGDSFAIAGTYVLATPYGTGHINDTYVVHFDQGGATVRYIFQRINQDVFGDIPALMQNIERTTQHLHRKLAEAGVRDATRRAMTLIPTREGESFHLDDEGRSWRAYFFIEKARTYDVLTSVDQAYEGAKAFGAFQKMLADLPAPGLNETIPNFHNGPVRFEAFQKALQKDSENRAAGAGNEIAFLERNAWIFDQFSSLLKGEAIPQRLTHNDCKMNNVMIDDITGEGICVIDLDTVMPGSALYDFGDIVRTSTCPAAEDTLDLAEVEMNMARFEALARGYLFSAGDFLTEAERDHLVLSGKLITLIVGTRFLTDHLSGDTYYKTQRRGHNLDRCRTQFRLVKSISEQEEEMNRLIKGL